MLYENFIRFINHYKYNIDLISRNDMKEMKDLNNEESEQNLL
jgi:hypothetical protein